MKHYLDLLLRSIFVVVLTLVVVRQQSPFPVRAATVRYATPTNGLTSGTCTSWATACTLLRAISVAVSGDEVWAKKGVYYPTTVPSTFRSAAFTPKSGVAVYGGFLGTETSREQRDWQNNLTVLSGDIDLNDNVDANGIAQSPDDLVGQNVYTVIYAVNLTANAIPAKLDGFVVTGGQTGYNNNGGGAYVYNASASYGSLVLENVTFVGNASLQYGGGVYIQTNAATLSNVVFKNNRAAQNGGGAYLSGSSTITLNNVTFEGNSANYGGGLYNATSLTQLSNVTFSDNTAAYDGGGIYADVKFDLVNGVFRNNAANGSNGKGGGIYAKDQATSVTNAVFVGNTAKHGGAIANDLLSKSMSAYYTNLTVYNNTALTGYGGGIYNNMGTAYIRNSILWGNYSASGGNANVYTAAFDATTQVASSDIGGCGGSGNWDTACGTNQGGNIDTAPLFMDATSGNLRLDTGSPAINAGDNSLIPSGVTTDLDGEARIQGGIVDMGAYEYSAPYVVSITRDDPDPTNADSVRFTVTFSEVVTGVDGGDFTLTVTGITDASITSLSGSGATYTVTVDTGTGDGTLRLDLKEAGTGIVDLQGYPISGGFTNGEVYTIDRTPPAVIEIGLNENRRLNANTVSFTLVFSEPVVGLEIDDLEVITTGTLSGVQIISVTGSGDTWMVTIDTGTGSGTIRLKVK